MGACAKDFILFWKMVRELVIYFYSDNVRALLDKTWFVCLKWKQIHK